MELELSVALLSEHLFVDTTVVPCLVYPHELTALGKLMYFLVRAVMEPQFGGLRLNVLIHWEGWRRYQTS